MRLSVNWSNIHYFKREEKWGDPGKVNPSLVYLVDEFRHFVGKPFILHCAYSKNGHSTTSQHYKGNALDGHFVGISWFDQYLLAMKFGKFNGIGVYPDWNNPGLHLDVRPLSGEAKHTWTRFKGEYMDVSEANLTKIFEELGGNVFNKPKKNDKFKKSDKSKKSEETKE